MKQIHINNLSFQYKNKPVIRDLTLELSGTQCTALIGDNGSGKTTIGKLITGILRPDKGNVLLDDIDLSTLSLSEIGSRIGYLFQNPSNQIFAITVREDLTFALRMNKIPDIIIQEKLNEVVEMFDLLGILDSKCHLLSQGEKQRVALGGLFMREPEYLILDEPTTGLDMVRKEALSGIIKSIKAKNIGVLIISHDFKFVEEHGDTIIDMETIC